MTWLTSRNGWIILVTLLLALVLSIMPIPIFARNFRPQWVTLVLIYWCLALPHRIGIGSAWTIGIVQDVITGTLLGQHALAQSAVAYATGSLHRRIRNFPLWQQSLTILILLLLDRLINLWVMAATSQATPDLWYWTPAITSALLWPWLYIILRDIRRRFNIT